MIKMKIVFTSNRSSNSTSFLLVFTSGPQHLRHLEGSVILTPHKNLLDLRRFEANFLYSLWPKSFNVINRT